MAGGEEPECLLLVGKEFARGPGRHGRQVLVGFFLGPGLVRGAEEQARLAALPVGCGTLAGLDRRLERLQHGGPLVLAVDTVEGAGLDQRLDRGAVDDLKRHSSAEVPQTAEGSAFAARLEDRAHRLLAHALDRGQAEADVAVRADALLVGIEDDVETHAGTVDVGRGRPRFRFGRPGRFTRPHSST